MSHWSAAACLLLALAGAARADLVCDRPEYDAGHVRGGVAVIHTFTLTNHGKETAEVGEPRTGCGCMLPVVGRRTLAPGESTTVRAEIHTVTQTAGPNEWRMLVPYVMPSQQGEVLLVVRAEVTPELSISPATVILHVDRAISHSLTLLERRDQALVLRGAATTCPQVQARVSQPEASSQGWRRAITLEVGPDCPEGRHEHALVVYTTDPNYPELKVPFTVVKRAPDTVRASPAEVEWRGLRGDPLPSRIVLLSSGSEKPIEIEGVTTSHECLECRYASGPGRRATLRIVCDGPPPAGLAGEVRVHVKGPTPGVLTIPVRVMP
jgi:hypothetical protein